MPGRSACCERSCSTKIGKGVPAWATGPLGHSIQLYGLVISVEFVWKLDTPRRDASFIFFPVLFLRWQSGKSLLRTFITTTYGCVWNPLYPKIPNAMRNIIYCINIYKRIAVGQGVPYGGFLKWGTQNQSSIFCGGFSILIYKPYINTFLRKPQHIPKKIRQSHAQQSQAKTNLGSAKAPSPTWVPERDEP